CPIHSMTLLWSLAVEEQFYFLWPWVVLFCNRKTLRWIALGMILGAPLLRAVFTPFFPRYTLIYFLTPFRVDSLAWGALIAVSVIEDTTWISRWRPKAIAAMVTAALLLAGLSAFHSFRMTANSESFNTLAYSLIELMYGSSLIWVLGMTEGWWGAIL